MVRTPEDEEFEEADGILADLRQKAETGESDLLWGDCLERSWHDGMLRVTRSYGLGSSSFSVAPVIIHEFPYSAHPCSGVGGTGGLVWRGALALAELLAERHELLANAEVILEIGAGCGLPGLAVAAQLASRGRSAQVILTDGPEAVLENLAANVAANLEQVKPVMLKAERLVWEDFLAGRSPAPVENVDLLIGSDVIWGDRGGLVAEVAMHLVRPGGALVISAQKGREGLDIFQEVLKSARPPDMNGFNLEVKEVSYQGEDFQIFIGFRIWKGDRIPKTALTCLEDFSYPKPSAIREIFATLTLLTWVGERDFSFGCRNLEQPLDEKLLANAGDSDFFTS